MATITDIGLQKRRKGYYNILIDGKFCCSLSEISLKQGNYHVHQTLTEAEAEQLKALSGIGKLKDATLRYLSVRLRSEHEIEQYLRRKLAEPETIAEIVDWLRGLRYLDDHKFAEVWVRDRSQTKARSKRELQAELAQKGIDRSIVQEVLAEYDQLDADALQKLIAKKCHLPRYQNKQKLQQYLLQHGFAYSAIKVALEQNDSNFDSEQTDTQ